MAARLERTPHGTELVTDEGLRLLLDFVGDRARYRKPHRGKNELIAKATGLSKGLTEIWDLTAGLAEDAWFLVTLGARVTAFERHPQIAALLQDAHERALASPVTTELAKRLEIRAEDARSVLACIDDHAGPSVIYLDPMFQFAKEKSALPRKEMQIFRSIVGADDDSTELLKEAIRVARDRVVVKRPIKEAPLLPRVQHRFEGSAIRYDFYSPRAL